MEQQFHPFTEENFWYADRRAILRHRRMRALLRIVFGLTAVLLIALLISRIGETSEAATRPLGARAALLADPVHPVPATPSARAGGSGGQA